MNKAANGINSLEDIPTNNCYGWDLMLDGDSDDTDSNQDLDMPDNPHGEISGDTRRMMDQQFAHPTHASISEDFMGLEDILNNVLQQLGENVESDPAEKVQALHEDSVQHDPILGAQTIEVQRRAHIAMALVHQPTPSQNLMDCCSEGAQGGTECVLTMEVDEFNYRHMDDSYLTILQSKFFFKAKEGQ